MKIPKKNKRLNGMSKEELNDKLQYLIDNHVITNKNNKFRVISMYRHNTKIPKDVIETIDEFISMYRSEKEAWYCLKNNITEPPKCPICGAPVKFADKKYNLTCENHSANQLDDKKRKTQITMRNKTEEDREKIKTKTKNTLLERYGDAHYGQYGSESFRKNLKEKYGDEYYSNHEKAKRTCLERYGVEYNLAINSEGRSKRIWDEKHDEIIAKVRKTNRDRYGKDYYVMTDEFKKKSKITQIKNFGSIEDAYKHRVNTSKNTLISRYNNETYHNVDKFKQTLTDIHTKYEEAHDCTQVCKLVDKYGQGWLSLNIPCIKNGRFRYIENKYIADIERYNEEIHNYKATSFQETELFEFIKSHTQYDVVRNIKDLIKDENGHKLELDIYIPDIKLGIEYNGDYWHSSYKKDKYYHQIKTKICYENGIQLIHIYGKDWINNRNIIESRIIQLLNGEDCSKYNWIPVQKYNEYILTEPEVIYINDNRSHNDPTNMIYNEGKFIKKDINNG